MLCCDQLSKSQPAMDCFRLFALLKLILKVELAKDQTRATMNEIGTKAAILLLGAQKRGVPTGKLYEDVKAWAEKHLAQDEFDSGRLREEGLTIFEGVKHAIQSR